MPLQWFMGVSDWDHGALRDELVRQVGERLGEAESVIVFDPSSFPKSGHSSVGVARQWCGRLGKVENCQVGVYMGYVSSQEHALVDTRLYVPKVWIEDAARCERAGLGTKVRYRTRHQLCLEMLEAHGKQLPHRWIAGDDEMGRPYWFRHRLDTLGEGYLLAVDCDTLIRDMDRDPPVYPGPGRPPKRPWQRVDPWQQAQPETAWTSVDVRDGEKGPLLVEVITRRVVGRTHRRQQGHPEVLVIIRYKDRDHQRIVKTDYYLSNAEATTECATFARWPKPNIA